MDIIGRIYNLSIDMTIYTVYAQDILWYQLKALEDMDIIIFIHMYIFHFSENIANEITN